MKNKLKINLILIILLACCQTFTGQNLKLLASLKRELKKSTNDTSRVMVLRNMASVMQNVSQDSSLAYAREGLSLSERIKFQKGIALCLIEIAYSYYGTNNQIFYENTTKALKISEQIGNKSLSATAFNLLGLYYCGISKDSLAITSYNKSLQYYNDLNDKINMAAVQNNIGLFYGIKGNFPLAIDYHIKALRNNEESKNENGLGWTLTYLASVYSFQNNFGQALEYANKAERLGKVLQDKSLQSWCFIIIGDVYANQKKNQLALYNYQRSMNIGTEIQGISLLARVNERMGSIYLQENNYEKALDYFNKSIKLSEEIDDKHLISEALSNIAEIFQKQGKLKESLIYGQKSFQLAEELKYPDIIKESADMLYKLYKQKADFNNALKYHEISVNANDSMFNEEKLKTINNLKENYEIDKKQKTIELLVKDKKLSDLKVVIFGAALIIVLILTLYIFSYKQRKAKIKQLKYESELRETRYLLDSKHRELTQKAIHIMQQEQILAGLKKQLLQIKEETPRKKEAILHLMSDIESYLKQSSWEDFEKYFIEVHPGFYQALKTKYADLTQNELRLCALMKLNLNTKQIAEITRKTPRSIEVMRSRVRQKMELTREDNLFDAISLT